MKPYGYQHEPSGIRDWPDVADGQELGLPSKHGKIKKRKAKRRFKRKTERQKTRQKIHNLAV